MNYKAVFIEKERYNTILKNFFNIERSKKSNYKFNIYQKENDYFLSHQVQLPKEYNLLTEDTKVRIILNKNKLNILYATKARKKINQEFDLI